MLFHSAMDRPSCKSKRTCNPTSLPYRKPSASWRKSTAKWSLTVETWVRNSTPQSSTSTFHQFYKYYFHHLLNRLNDSIDISRNALEIIKWKSNGKIPLYRWCVHFCRLRCSWHWDPSERRSMTRPELELWCKPTIELALQFKNDNVQNKSIRNESKTNWCENILICCTIVHT